MHMWNRLIYPLLAQGINENEQQVYVHVTQVDISSTHSRYQWNWTTGLCTCDTGWYILYLLKVSMKLNNGSMCMWQGLSYPLLAQVINEIEQWVYAHVSQVNISSSCSRYQWNWIMGVCACDSSWYILYSLKISMKFNNWSMHMWHGLTYPLLAKGINEIVIGSMRMWHGLIYPLLVQGINEIEQ